MAKRASEPGGEDADGRTATEEARAEVGGLRQQARTNAVRSAGSRTRWRYQRNLFEAAVLALSEFRRAGIAAVTPGPGTRLKG